MADSTAGRTSGSLFALLMGMLFATCASGAGYAIQSLNAPGALPDPGHLAGASRRGGPARNVLVQPGTALAVERSRVR